MVIPELSLLFLILALFIVVHHWSKHGPTSNQPLTGVNRYFQMKDISNHETWVIVSLIISLYSGLIANGVVTIR